MIEITFDQIEERCEKGDLKEWLDALREADVIEKLCAEPPKGEDDGKL